MFKRRLIALMLGLAMMFSATSLATASSSMDLEKKDLTLGVRAHQFRVITSVLNVRSGPGTGYSTVGKLYNGDLVWLDTSGERTYANGYWWVKIYNNNLSGWVAEQYIENIS